MMKTTCNFALIMISVLCLASYALAQDQAKADESKSSIAVAKATNAEETKEETEKITWLTYEDGINKAKKEDKAIVIDFTASWCGWCKRMERDTFSNEEVIDYMNNNVVPIKVWGDSDKKTSHQGEVMSERALTRVYGVRGFPTFWFLSSQGERIGPTSGYKKKEQFLPLVQYVAGDHYKTMSYENFLKKSNGDG